MRMVSTKNGDVPECLRIGCHGAMLDDSCVGGLRCACGFQITYADFAALKAKEAGEQQATHAAENAEAALPAGA